MDQFALTTQHRDDTLIVTPVGDLDIATCSQLDEVLKQARGTQYQIVLDMSGVDFMDSRSLAVIVAHWKALVAAGGWLRLAGARYHNTRALWITGLASRIPMYDTVEQAIAATA